MSARINLLCTKRMDPLLVGKAAVKCIRIAIREFIRIEPMLGQDVAARVSATDDASCFIFTSINAVETLYRIMNRHNLVMPRGIHVYATEGRTATRVRTLFPQFLLVDTAVRAADLARKIIAAKETNPVWFCGNLRMQDLPDMLGAAHINLREMQVYHTEPTPVKIEDRYDGLIFFSPSAVSSYLEKNSIPNGTTCFAIGETTAGALRDHSGNIRIAAAASQEKMVEMIIEHYKV